MQTAQNILQNVVVNPESRTDQSSNRPTEIRYGWNPYKEINLVGGAGTIEYYVQPENSPYHRVLPKNHLIPFPTFNIDTFEVDNTPSSNGRRNPLIASSEQKTAYVAASEILYGYSRWGFTVIRAFQGLDQETAHRIFAVISPFNYRIGELIGELGFAAENRINAEDDLIFQLDDGTQYTVESLRYDYEREIARRAAGEMLAGAEIAFALATETLNETETSMTNRFAGGKGKTGADKHDRYLAEELGRELPQLVGQQKPDDTGKKIDFLVEREAARSDREEIERLKAELAEAKAVNQQILPEILPVVSTEDAKIMCDALTNRGEPCKNDAQNGETKCPVHLKQA